MLTLEPDRLRLESALYHQEVLGNTIAMELLAVERAWRSGDKREQLAFMEFNAKIGDGSFSTYIISILAAVRRLEHATGFLLLFAKQHECDIHVNMTNLFIFRQEHV